MPTSGQPNDYAVSKNAGPNMVDVLGLLAISGQTIVVSKCEIVIVYGHRWESLHARRLGPPVRPICSSTTAR